LRQKIGPLDLVGVFLENTSIEQGARLILRFVFGVDWASSSPRNRSALVPLNDLEFMLSPNICTDFFGLVLAQQAVVNKNALELVSGGLVDQRRRQPTKNQRRLTARKFTFWSPDLLRGGSFSIAFLAVGVPWSSRPVKPAICHKFSKEFQPMGVWVPPVELDRKKLRRFVGGDCKGAWGPRCPEPRSPGAMAVTWSSVAHPQPLASAREPAVSRSDLVPQGHVGHARIRLCRPPPEILPPSTLPRRCPFISAGHSRWPSTEGRASSKPRDARRARARRREPPPGTADRITALGAKAFPRKASSTVN